MTGALRMTTASARQLVRGRDVLVAALVVPLVTLGILALYADLDFDTGQTFQRDVARLSCCAA